MQEHDHAPKKPAPRRDEIFRRYGAGSRTNVPRPLSPHHFAEFEACFGGDPNGQAKRKPGDSKEDRWRSFPLQRGAWA